MRLGTISVGNVLTHLLVLIAFAATSVIMSFFGSGMVTAARLPHLQNSISSISAKWIKQRDEQSTHSFDLVRRSDPRNSVPPLPGAAIEFSTVTIGETDNLAALLLNRGILPSSDTYALIYKSNPEVKDLSQIRSGMQIRLPALVGGFEVQRSVKEGIVASPKINLEERQSVVRKIEEFASANMAFTSITPSIEDPDGMKTAGVQLIQRIRLTLNLIKANTQENIRPVDNETLKHTSVLVSFGTKIINKVIQGRRFERQDFQKLESLKFDIELSAEAFGNERGAGSPPPPWQTQLVHVLVRRAGARDEALFYRIRYAPKAIYEDNPEREFEEISRSTPNAKKDMPEGRFYFWAIAESSNTRAGEPKFDTIRKRTDGQPQIIELIVP